MEPGPSAVNYEGCKWRMVTVYRKVEGNATFKWVIAWSEYDIYLHQENEVQNT